MRIMKQAQANAIFQDAVDTVVREKGEVGLQVAAYLDGELIVDVQSGIADLETGRRVDRETLFPVFSVVKAVTAVALHLQAERGLIDYEAPISRYWPEFAANGKDKATIRDALSHRLGIPQMPSRLAAGHPRGTAATLDLTSTTNGSDYLKFDRETVEKHTIVIWPDD